MSAQVFFHWILLYFAVCDIGTVAGQAAANTACSTNHLGHSKCREINADCFLSQKGGYKCVCSKEYWMIDGKCQKSDWCADGEIGDIACKSTGTVCKNLEWTSETHTQAPFKCECESKVVQSRICSVTSLYCRDRGASSSRFGNITVCDCTGNSFFDYTTSKCQSLDLCPFMDCKGKYEECQGSECVCKTAYEGDVKAGLGCKPKNYCHTNNKCGSAKCEEGPVDDPKSIRCYCDNGYVLSRKNSVPYCKLVMCETQSLNPCDQMCIYSTDQKSYQCGCLPGHTLKPDGITCEIQPENKCAFNVCKAKSICVKLNGTEECMCKTSLIGRGPVCLDRCGAGSLQQGTCPGECKSTENGFQCICEGKYRLSKNQVTCEERQMCLEGEAGFLNCSQQNRICVERPETEMGFVCDKCLRELQEHEGNCMDLCQIDKNKRYCQERGGTCLSVNGVTLDVKCKCPPFLTWNKNVGCVFARHSYTGELRIFDSYKNKEIDDSNGTLRYAEAGIDWKKLNHDVEKSMSTLFGQALSQVNVLQCRPDTLDVNHDLCIICAIELQLHFEDYGILQRLNSHSVCRGGIRVLHMFCFIPPYLKLVPRRRTDGNVDVPFHKSNACGILYGLSVCPASTECVLEDVGFSCRCKMGFANKRTLFLNNDKSGVIEVCEDVNECEVREPCPNGTTCINTIGDFECRCKPGFFRWHQSGNPKEDICTEACGPVKCIHGTCQSHKQGFYCRCHKGYNGVYCEESFSGDTEPSTDHNGMGQTAVIVVGIIEAVVAFVILAVVFHRFWIRRTPKHNENDVNRNVTRDEPNVRNLTIDHIHMRSALNPPREVVTGGFPQPLEDDPDDPIYADCSQVR